MYAEHTLNQIRAQADIVEVVSEYVPLKKSGTSYSGMCPFHKEKTGSFHVHPLKQVFHCFGCHKGGNVFTFISAIEGIAFPLAVQKLARKLGITLEEDKKFAPKKGPTVSAKVPKLHAAIDWAAKYFHYLLTEMPEYGFAKNYLKSRGITDETIKKFQLGVSPKGWNTLLDLMLKRKFTFEELVEAGLVIQKENTTNQGYDRFRERLMFPITNIEGNRVGFGARILKDEPNQPKYLNSPESPLFSKRNTLYGFNENQRGIRLRSEAVLVEGYMDVVGLFQAGVDNAVATMGTALTEEHCGSLKKATKKVVTVFDPDKGGVDAWHRSVSIFMQEGIFAKDLTLPDGLDPDEFVLKNGADAFYKLCAEAPRQITKYLREISKKGALNQDLLSKHLQEFIPILTSSRRLADRAALWDDISLVFKISVEGLKELSESGMQRGDAKPKEQPKQETRPHRPVPKKRFDLVDREFFKFAIHNLKDFQNMPKRDWELGMKEPKLIEWVTKLSKVETEDQAEALFQEMINNEDHEEILAIVSERLTGTAADGRYLNKQELQEIFLAMKRRVKEKEIKDMTLQIKLCQRMGQAEEELKLLERLKEMRSTEPKIEQSY